MRCACTNVLSGSELRSFLTAAGLLIPVAQSLTAVIVLVSIAASFGNVGPAANGALVGDLLRSSADAGRAFAFLVLGGNTFGLLAPIVTGYLVEATGSFNSAFILAGALALIGAVVTLALARTPIGEVGARGAAQARRLRLGLYRRTTPAAGKAVVVAGSQDQLGRARSARVQPAPG